MKKIALLCSVLLLAACGNSGLPAVVGSALPSLKALPAQGSEGSDTGLIFTVQLSAAGSAPVRVSYTTRDGTAKAGTDYTATSGELLFAPGETAKEVRVPLTGNDCHDLARAMTLELSEPESATIDTASATGTLLDDDAGGASYRAAAAKRVVSPGPELFAGVPHEFCPTTVQNFYLGGFGIRDVDVVPCTPLVVPIKPPATGVAKDIHLRVLLLQQGDDKLAFVTLDAIGIGNVIQEGVKRRISEVTGTPKESILFGATHTHQSGDLQGLWGGVPFEWRQQLYAAAEEAATEAQAALADAEISYGQTDLDEPSFNNYRRTDATIGTDKRMTVLQVRRPDQGTVLATLVQYVAHPTVIGSSNSLVHGDWVAGFHDAIEAAWPGSTSIYFNGPIADASPNTGAADPLPPEDADAFVRADAFGRTLAGKAVALADAGLKRFAPQVGPQIVAQHRVASVPVTNHLFLALAAKGYFNGYYDFLMPPDPDATATPAPQVMNVANVLVSRVSLGKPGCTALEIATLPGEASSLVGRYIRGLSESDMMLLGLTHESLGYLLDESQYTTENGTGLITEPDPLFPLGYEEGVSMGPLSVPTLRQQAYAPLFGAAGLPLP